MRTKKEYRTTSRETYSIFCKEYPDVKISFQLFRKLIETFNNMIVKHVLDTGDSIKLPYGLGAVAINKYQRNRHVLINGEKKIHLKIDFKATKEEGKTIYHLNECTDGNNYSWKWFERSSRIRCSHLWKFRACRGASRLLASYLKKFNSPYKEIYKTWNQKRFPYHAIQ